MRVCDRCGGDSDVKEVVFITRPMLIGITSAGKTWPIGPDLCLTCRNVIEQFIRLKVTASMAKPLTTERGWVDLPIPGLEGNDG